MTIYEDESINIVGLIREFWTPVLVAIVGYLASRLSLTVKKIELLSQTKLRAKELYFESYQKDLESVGEAARSESKAHAGNCLKLFQIEKDENRKISTIRSYINVHHKHIEIYSVLYHELLSKVKNSPIINDTTKLQVEFIESVFATDIDMIPDEKVEKYFFDLAKAYVLITKLEQNLIEMKRDDLFSSYT